jgi:hypothetical protein
VCSELSHPADLQFHHEATRQRIELTDLVDDASLLCPPCHSALHAPSVSALRARTRPSCPSCGRRENVRPIVWGMPAGPLDDELVAAGCALPDGPLPRWRCTACGGDFGPAGHSGASGPPARRTETLLRSTRALAQALDAATLDDLAAQLSDDLDANIRLTELECGDGYVQVEVRRGHVGVAIALPMTIRELWDALDDLAKDLEAEER